MKELTEKMVGLKWLGRPSNVIQDRTISVSAFVIVGPAPRIDEEDFNYPLLQVVCGPFIVMALYYFFRNARQDSPVDMCECTV